MDKKAEMGAYISGIIQENRDHPPKAAQTKCNRCKKHQQGAKCSKYPTLIPEEIVFMKKECPEFEQAQERFT